MFRHTEPIKETSEMSGSPNIDLDGIEARAYHATQNRHRWASEVGVDDRDVIDGLRRAKQLAVDDVPTLVAEVRRLRAAAEKVAGDFEDSATEARIAGLRDDAGHAEALARKIRRDILGQHTR